MAVSIPIASLPFGAFFDDELSAPPNRKLTLVVPFPIFLLEVYDNS